MVQTILTKVNFDDRNIQNTVYPSKFDAFMAMITEWKRFVDFDEWDNILVFDKDDVCVTKRDDSDYFATIKECSTEWVAWNITPSKEEDVSSFITSVSSEKISVDGKEWHSIKITTIIRDDAFEVARVNKESNQVKFTVNQHYVDRYCKVSDKILNEILKALTYVEAPAKPEEEHPWWED